MNRSPLSFREKLRRLAALLLVAATGAALAFFPGNDTDGFVSCPLQDTCGIPCLLCGGTRALQALLAGDWARAVYLNWLAFPVGLASAAWMFHWLREILIGQRIPIRIICRPRHFLILAAALFALWGFHIHDALATPKPELLNTQALGFRIFQFRMSESGLGIK